MTNPIFKSKGVDPNQPEEQNVPQVKPVAQTPEPATGITPPVDVQEPDTPPVDAQEPDTPPVDVQEPDKTPLGLPILPGIEDTAPAAPQVPSTQPQLPSLRSTTAGVLGAASNLVDVEPIEAVPTLFHGPTLSELIDRERKFTESLSSLAPVQQPVNKYEGWERLMPFQQERTSPFQFRPDSTRRPSFFDEWKYMLGIGQDFRKPDGSLDWGRIAAHGLSNGLYALGLFQNTLLGAVADINNAFELSKQIVREKTKDIPVLGELLKGVTEPVDPFDPRNPIRPNIEDVRENGPNIVQALKGRNYNLFDDFQPLTTKKVDGKDVLVPSGQVYGMGRPGVKWYADPGFWVGFIAQAKLPDPADIPIGWVWDKTAGKLIRKFMPKPKPEVPTPPPPTPGKRYPIYKLPEPKEITTPGGVIGIKLPKPPEPTIPALKLPGSQPVLKPFVPPKIPSKVSLEQLVPKKPVTIPLRPDLSYGTRYLNIGPLNKTLPKIDFPDVVVSPKLPPPEVKFPKIELPKTKTPKVETPKVETPKVETPEAELPKVEPPKVDTPQVEPPKVETPDVEPPKVETPDVEPPKTELPKAETPEIEAVKPQVEEPQPTVPAHPVSGYGDVLDIEAELPLSNKGRLTPEELEFFESMEPGDFAAFGTSTAFKPDGDVIGNQIVPFRRPTRLPEGDAANNITPFWRPRQKRPTTSVGAGNLMDAPPPPPERPPLLPSAEEPIDTILVNGLEIDLYKGGYIDLTTLPEDLSKPDWEALERKLIETYHIRRNNGETIKIDNSQLIAMAMEGKDVGLFLQRAYQLGFRPVEDGKIIPLRQFKLDSDIQWEYILPSVRKGVERPPEIPELPPRDFIRPKGSSALGFYRYFPDYSELDLSELQWDDLLTQPNTIDLGIRNPSHVPGHPDIPFVLHMERDGQRFRKPILELAPYHGLEFSFRDVNGELYEFTGYHLEQMDAALMNAQSKLKRTIEARITPAQRFQMSQQLKVSLELGFRPYRVVDGVPEPVRYRDFIQGWEPLSDEYRLFYVPPYLRVNDRYVREWKPVLRWTPNKVRFEPEPGLKPAPQPQLKPQLQPEPQPQPQPKLAPKPAPVEIAPGKLSLIDFNNLTKEVSVSRPPIQLDPNASGIVEDIAIRLGRKGLYRDIPHPVERLSTIINQYTFDKLGVDNDTAKLVSLLTENYVTAKIFPEYEGIIKGDLQNSIIRFRLDMEGGISLDDYRNLLKIADDRAQQMSKDILERIGRTTDVVDDLQPRIDPELLTGSLREDEIAEFLTAPTPGQTLDEIKPKVDRQISDVAHLANYITDKPIRTWEDIPPELARILDKSGLEVPFTVEKGAKVKVSDVAQIQPIRHPDEIEEFLRQGQEAMRARVRALLPDDLVDNELAERFIRGFLELEDVSVALKRLSVIEQNIRASLGLNKKRLNYIPDFGRQSIVESVPMPKERGRANLLRKGLPSISSNEIQGVFYHGTRVSLPPNLNIDPILGGARGPFGPAFYLTRNADEAKYYAIADLTRNVPLADAPREVMDAGRVYAIRIPENLNFLLNNPKTKEEVEAMMRLFLDLQDELPFDTKHLKHSLTLSSKNQKLTFDRAIEKAAELAHKRGFDVEVDSLIYQRDLAAVLSKKFDGIYDPDSGLLAVFDPSKLIIERVDNIVGEVDDVNRAVARFNADTLMAHRFPKSARAVTDLFESGTALQARLLESVEESMNELLDTQARLVSEVSESMRAVETRPVLETLERKLDDHVDRLIQEFDNNKGNLCDF